MQRILRDFFKLEAASGIILLIMAVIAMIWSNSPLDKLHEEFVENYLFWINDGLMAVFFLIVGLELKRGFLEGQFAHISQVLLPLVAAIGGMVVPAIIYFLVNKGDSVILQGWATPVATDIAFALGILSLFGSRVPRTLKLFLLALAIFDDIGAILIIGVFYSHGVQYIYLVKCLVLIGVLWLLNRMSVRMLSPYLLFGMWLWYYMLCSGIHPTLAGVLLAFMIPDGEANAYSPLHILERRLHPWVAYLIMPLFALANAGFSFAGMSLDILTEGIVLGIVLGLFIGKQLGVFGVTWLFVKAGWGKLLQNVTWIEIYGISLVCGIGFTMSLFLGTLSFQSQPFYLDQVRLGVLLGSLISGLCGAGVLWVAFRHKTHEQ